VLMRTGSALSVSCRHLHTGPCLGDRRRRRGTTPLRRQGVPWAESLP